jgi:hypothetical protein
MPIHEILRRQGVFEPNEVAMLGQVFEDVLRSLGLVGSKDPMTEMVAKKLTELATSGVRDPDRLKALTVQAFTQQQQQQIQPERHKAGSVGTWSRIGHWCKTHLNPRKYDGPHRPL